MRRKRVEGTNLGRCKRRGREEGIKRRKLSWQAPIRMFIRFAAFGY